jgi:copper chaperone CopZ
MTCAACSDTVKKALQKVEGVEKTEVNYDKKEAVVTYDDAKTGVEALTKATALHSGPWRRKIRWRSPTAIRLSRGQDTADVARVQGEP